MSSRSVSLGLIPRSRHATLSRSLTLGRYDIPRPSSVHRHAVGPYGHSIHDRWETCRWAHTLRFQPLPKGGVPVPLRYGD
jgi:hypothetical protein